MTLLEGVLGLLLFVAVLYILIDRVMFWLIRRGGLCIRFEVDDDDKP